MPITLEGQAVEVLQRLVRDIATRAERIQQLLEVGSQYRAFDAAYDPMTKEVGKENKAWPLLKDQWRTARDNNLVELQSLLQNDCHAVRLALSADPGGGYAPVLDQWSAQIKDLRVKLEAAVNGEVWGDLKLVCPSLQDAVKEHIARHKKILATEASRLSLITERLKEKLEA